jgi:hypothetical protein
MFTMPRRGIVNVRMVITEEKILSNIDKIHRLIAPNGKKQIIELEDDTYFKDLVESIKTYLIEYPKKKNFPKSIYDAAYQLVEFATEQFEENTKQIEDLIKKREYNIKTAAILKQTYAIVESGDPEWKKSIDEVSERLPEDVVQALYILGKDETKNKNNQERQAAIKLINAKISNLQSNLHIEIDLERVEDRSKALSYIGIEIADALKLIPVPVATSESEKEKKSVEQKETESNTVVVNTQNVAPVQESKPYEEYYNETRREVKESMWHKFMNSKVVKAIKYAFKIRIRLQLPEGLPDGDVQSNKQ